MNYDNLTKAELLHLLKSCGEELQEIHNKLRAIQAAFDAKGTRKREFERWDGTTGKELP